MMTVHEVARRVGVTLDAVRYYVRIGLLYPQRSPSNGYRLFSPEDIKRLRFILRAKKLGFTLTEIRQIFSDTEQSCSPCPAVRDILKRRIRENKKTIDELVLMQQRMEQAQSEWDQIPDGVPDDKTLCPLIEYLGA